ncbi:MAG TPA: diguanylate cyclase, partial [Terriglobia bacterium]|nr:diguanylate cyclase [Terriglobia bacterium]
HARQHADALAAADHDSVTNLLNHRAVHQRLDRMFSETRDGGGTLAIMMVDLNNFKLFNDTYGHVTGDQVLKKVAKVLNEECSSEMLTARYGGDEFMVVLPDASAERAHILATKIRSRLHEEGFNRPSEEGTVPISLSFGIACYPNDGRSRHELLTIADSNLYQAKNSDEGIVFTSESQRANRELRAEASFEVLDALITAVDNKDRYTRKHSEDVTEYALWMAEELGLSEETMRTLRIGGLLHDVGKIGVPDEILRKPGRLSPEEFEVMKRHPRLGELIVGGIPGMESILDAVRSHHERWDGLGYPDQLEGEQIPFMGRLLAVADAFSAMTTDRPYRKGMEFEVALEEIRSNIGTQFDPQMAQAFIQGCEKRGIVLPTRTTMPKAA